MTARSGIPAALLLLSVVGPVWAQTAPADTTAPPAPPTAFPDTFPAPTTVASAQFAALGGDQSASRPYRQEPSVYFGAPPLRYNRVEGAVVGLQVPPSGWQEGATVQPFGQLSYALGLRRWRGVAGAEARLVTSSSPDEYGLKVGAHLAHTTASEDHWKRSWQDNAVSTLLYGRDLYNYYDVRAATAYLTQRLSPRLQITVGARWAEHDALPRTTDWALLASGSSRPNPPADAGEARLGLLIVEGGELTKWSETRSVGTIARLYGEADRLWPGSLAYDRAIVDVQTYQAVAPSFNLNLRGRAGWTSDDAPIQMQFRLDGVRGLRGIEPVTVAEERLLLGGAELVWHDVPVPSWLGRAQGSLFADLGWTGDRFLAGGQSFTFAGVSAGVFDRLLTVEVTWNLAVPRPDVWTPQATLSVNPLR